MPRSKKLPRKQETVVKTPTDLILTTKRKNLQVSVDKCNKQGEFYFNCSQMAFCCVFDTFYTADAFGETKFFERKTWFVCSKFPTSHSAIPVQYRYNWICTRADELSTEN